MEKSIKISEQFSIPASEVRFHFARSGGKGGQNVNKVETKVELLFDIAHSPSLSDVQRGRLFSHLRSRLDSDGVLHIVSQESRSQWKNREEAVRRFVDLLQHALKPRKKRIATKVSRGAKEQRLESKKRRSKVIRSRRIEE